MAAKTSTGTLVINAVASGTTSTYASPTAGCQSASQDITTALGAMWILHATNGTAPTLGVQFQVDVSYNGTAWRALANGIFPVTASTSFDAVVELPFPTMYTRVTFFGNTVNTVTCTAELSVATGIA